MSDQLTVSNSEITTFKRCRRKWWFAYYRRLGLRRESPIGPRSIGTRVHACVAAYYNGLAPVYDVNRGSNALKLHDQLVAEDLVRCPEEADDITKDADLSRAMVEGYFEWLEESGADEGLTVIGAEQTVETELEVWEMPPIKVRAKLDLKVLRATPDGRQQRRFLDHKTVQEFTTPTRTLHLDEQMLMYDWLESVVNGEHVGGAIYNMLRKVKRTSRAKPPFFERFEVEHSPAEIHSFYRRLLVTLREMYRLRENLDKHPDHADAIAYPTPTRNCSWDCDWFPVCPLIDRPDLGRGAHLIEQLYTTVDPNARYGDSDADAI